MQRSETQFVKNSVNILVLRTPRTLKIRISQPDAEDDVTFPYMISLGDDHISGEVKNNEILEEAFKKDVDKGELWVWFYGLDNPATLWEFEIRLEPHQNEIIDTQTKLNALSYPCGPVDGISGPLTASGLHAFQTDNDITPCGELTNETTNKLQTIYGS